MVLAEQNDPTDLSVIGIMNGLNVRVQPVGEPPNELNFIVHPIALFASFEAPKKKEACEITTLISSPDMIYFRMDPVATTIPFDDPRLEISNLTIRMDGMRIRVPFENGRYKIVAKWKVNSITVGQLDLTVNTEIIEPE